MTITIIPVTWFKKIGDKLFPKSIKKIFGLNEISTEYINSSRSIISPILKSDSMLANINGLMVYYSEYEFVDLVAGNKDWRGIASKGTILYACVYGGSIWKSVDDGTNWTDLETGNKDWLGITEKDDILYACVNEGSIWKSVDDGTNWIDLETGNKDWIFISASDNYLFAIDISGVLYRSSDGFVSFEEITTGFLNNIKTIRQVNNYLLAGNGNKIMKSTDDGINWSELSTLPDTSTIQEIIASKYTSVIYAYDQSGKIYYSVDGGVNWLEKDTGTETISKFYGIANNEYLYICCSQSSVGTIIRAKMYNFVGNDNGSTIFFGKHEIAESSDEDAYENLLYISKENGRLTTKQNGDIFDASVPRATASHDGKILAVVGSSYALLSSPGTVSGDVCTKDVYDPNGMEDDAFNMDNMNEGETNVILTNEAQTIDGIKTFSSFPVTPSEEPSEAYEVANKKYVDDNAGSTGMENFIIQANSGTNQTVGDGNTVYLLGGSGIETNTTAEVANVVNIKLSTATAGLIAGAIQSTEKETAITDSDTKVPSSGAVVDYTANLKLGEIVFGIGNGTDAITTGDQLLWVPVSYAGTITECELTADDVGSIVVDIWKDTYENSPPTIADTIVASAKPTLSSEQKSVDSTLTGWTKTFNAGDIFKINVDSATTVKRVVLKLKVSKS